MFDFIDLFRSALNLWDDKEKHKYQDQFLELEGKYRDAINKPDDLRDDLLIANIDFQLRQLSRSFIFAAAGQVAPSQPDTSGA